MEARERGCFKFCGGASSFVVVLQVFWWWRNCWETLLFFFTEYDPGQRDEVQVRGAYSGRKVITRSLLTRKGPDEKGRQYKEIFRAHYLFEFAPAAVASSL